MKASSEMSSSERRSRRRRLREAVFPLLSAGLLKFPETREYYKIRLDPKMVLLIAIGLVVLVLILDIAFPPAI